MKFKQFLKNFSYAFSSNLISLLISAVIVFIVPKIISVQQYGYFQLYLFYTSYVGILHFGWFDGIYLRYGGLEYDKLDKQKFNSQFVMSFMLEVVIALIIWIIGVFQGNPDSRFIIEMCAAAIIIMNMQQILLYILQGTNRIREYVLVTIINRFVYLGGILLCLVFQWADYRYFVYSDLLGRMVTFGLAIYFCKEIVFTKFNGFDFPEMKENINVGYKLVFANFTSMLIIGIVRYGVQFRWGVKAFGKLSLTMNISNLMMLFVTAISVVLFPVLRRITAEKYNLIYRHMRTVLMVTLFSGLLIYYPVATILSLWLPKYSQSLVYMGLLFPICIFDGKFELLVNTFMKTLRLEKMLLKINVIAVLVSILLTIFNVFVLRSFSFVMISIVLILGVRSTIGEYYLQSKLQIDLRLRMVEEWVMTGLFMIISWWVPFPINMGVYAVVLVGYLLLNYRDIKESIFYIKGMV